MVELSSNLLYASFILYLIAIVFFGGAIRQTKGIEGNQIHKTNRSAKIGILITIIGFLSQIGYFITRWIAAGHPPVSNMFEFITFFSIMFVGAFIVIYFIYRSVVLGLFTLPIVLIIIAYGSMFTKDITPLIPALQSHWLPIHVMTTAAGQGILAISFVAGLIFLIKVIDQNVPSFKRFTLEMIMYFVIVVIGFILITSTFSAIDYEAEFEWKNKDGEISITTYHLPAIIGPNEWKSLTDEKMEPIIEMPALSMQKG